MRCDRSHRSTPAAGSCHGSFPWAAPLLIAALAVAIAAVPGAAPVLQWDREAIAQGQVWRLLTGHLTHWSLDHLAWDVLAFAVLGVWAWSQNAARFWWTLIGSSLAIGAALWLWQPALIVYRGLSGIDSALFALVAVTVWRRGSCGWRWAAIVALLAFMGKTVFELATGSALFVQALGPGVSAVPLAHLVGAAMGGVCGIPMPELRFTPSPSTTAR